MSRSESNHSTSTPTLHEPQRAAPTAMPSKYPPSTSEPVDSYTIKKRPWRRYVTPFENILNHKYPGSGTDEDPYIIDWLPNDPEDPQRWSQSYKWFNIGVAAIATLAVALSSSAYTGGIPDLIRQFHASDELLIAGVSLFVVGFAFGPLMWAPMSEVFGRRIVFIISLGLMTVWQAVTPASPNIAAVIVFRFLAGFFGSSPLANAGGTISDVLDANQRGLGMAMFAAAPFLGPSLGPITGGFLGLTSGWRWVMGFLAIFTGVLTLVLIVLSAETYAPFLLRNRADTLSKATGKQYRYRADAKQPLVIKTLFKGALLRPWKFLIYEPIVMILTIYTALVYGILYLNFAAYPIVFQEGRGWNTGIGGLAFLGILVGTIISVLLSIFYINPQYLKVAKAKGGRADPEDRLPPAIWGGVLIVIGIAGFAATDSPNIHWIAPIMFGIPFGTGVIVMFLAVLNYLVESYLIYAASVLAANSVLRSLFGAAFPLFTSYMYKALGVHWAAALPGFFALALIPFIAVFYKYGAKIRANCKYSADAERQMAAMMAARAQQNKQDEEANAESSGSSAETATGGGEASVSNEPKTQSGQVNEKTSSLSGDPSHPSHPEHPDHHEWTIYEILADRDEIDMRDDERLKLEELHEKFDYQKKKN
ncbi:putative transporter [Kockovaella imperatae]|uniref:Putative transporter n=1 Tax=Kockovaella imperatae TaxID=4999 RepID=A0A1Y1U7X0_9TREE|nr:putative transporter [Kockovaella imperatae]ORX34129.1 putative transporter [Kockovaella imperatae]